MLHTNYSIIITATVNVTSSSVIILRLKNNNDSFIMIAIRIISYSTLTDPKAPHA